jgi:acetyltransferase-like isoleucine patch superfamily enzyme
MKRVRYWIFGHGVIAWQDPRQKLILDGPSWPTFKVVEGVVGKGLPVTVGRYSGLHPTVSILVGSEHDPGFVCVLGGHMRDGQWVLSDVGIDSRGPVTVGNDVWVGYEACVLSGVTIGDGAIVGARALVRKSVEPFSIVAGNPAKHIRYRFEAPVREALLRIRWWDWSDDVVAAHAAQIHSAEVDDFVANHDPALGPPRCPICSG